MTIAEAKTILLRHRPGHPEAAEPEMAEALELARRHPELQQWLDEHITFQTGVRDKLRQIEPPPGLKERLLAAQKIIRLPVWRRPAWLAAAALLVVLLALAAVWLRPAVPDSFAHYQRRMVRAVLREYRMDIRTNDLRPVLQLMARQGAPADFPIPPALKRLTLTGGGLMRWRGEPVSMMCFDRGDRQMLFLFVMQRDAVRDVPPPTPRPEMINKLQTISWTDDRWTFLLAGPEDPDFERKYFGGAVP